eukprot:6478178-Amphidinium_carterae.2
MFTLTGAIPSSLNPEVAFLGHKLLGGPIPQHLLGGSKQAEKIVAAKALECYTCQQGQQATCLARRKVLMHLVQYNCVNIAPRSLRSFCHRVKPLLAAVLASTGGVVRSLRCLDWCQIVSLGMEFVGWFYLLFGRSGLGSKFCIQKTMLICFPTKAEALLLEGTIPESASRLTVAEITISLGHGLRGLLPSILGTVGLLSLWENKLEGHLRGAW